VSRGRTDDNMVMVVSADLNLAILLVRYKQTSAWKTDESLSTFIHYCELMIVCACEAVSTILTIYYRALIQVHAHH